MEDANDHRIRTVALTDAGREIIVPVFRRHADLMKRLFSDLSPSELSEIESFLKRQGKRAVALHQNDRLVTVLATPLLSLTPLPHRTRRQYQPLQR